MTNALRNDVLEDFYAQLDLALQDAWARGQVDREDRIRRAMTRLHNRIAENGKPSWQKESS